MTESDEDEHTPLLQQQSLPQRRLFSQFTVLIPIALATRGAGFLPSTTIIQIAETVVCRLWYEMHEPGRFPDAEACKIAPVKERFAGTMAALTTAEAVTCEFTPLITLFLVFTWVCSGILQCNDRILCVSLWS